MIALLGGIIAIAISRLLRIGLPFRLRPLYTPNLGLRIPFSVSQDTLNTWNSFPTDHAVLSFALSVPIWMHSLPRVYLGYHYASDVLAGALVGVVLMMAILRALQHAAPPDRVVALEARYPRAFYAATFLTGFELAVLSTIFATSRSMPSVC